MDKRSLFVMAHKMTKAVIKLGDSYSHTFGQCLKLIKQRFIHNDRQSPIDYELLFAWLLLALVCLSQGVIHGFNALAMLAEGMQSGLLLGGSSVIALILAQAFASLAWKASKECVESV